MIQRSGEVVLNRLANVQQATIAPFLKATIALGTTVDTDEHDLSSRLKDWGDKHRTVNHGKKEDARDDDGDGFHEVHVNTLQGFWSLLRSWRRPHSGLSQEKLPIDRPFFQFVHNIRQRGKALLESLMTCLVSSPPRITD